MFKGFLKTAGIMKSACIMKSAGIMKSAYNFHPLRFSKAAYIANSGFGNTFYSNAPVSETGRIGKCFHR
jgi:hypothetical protein